MAHSLEARLPYLDQELVDYILTLPRAAIIHNGWTRAIVRPGVARCPAPQGRGAPQEDRLHDARVPLVPASARGAPEPDAVTVVSRPPYWKAAAVAENFRRACAGEVEESMFFWRAVNAEVWLRIYIDGKTRALDEHSYEGGFVRRGDQATARRVANGRRSSTARASTGAVTSSSRTGDGSGRASRCARRSSSPATIFSRR